MVTTSSSDVADEEQFFFAQPDSQDEAEEQILERKAQFQKKAAEWIANQELSSMKPSIKKFTKIDGNTTSYSINGINANAQIGTERNAVPVLKNLKLKILGQPHDLVLLTTDRRFKHYKQMRIALFSKMDCYSGNTTEKLVASDTTKFSYQSS